MVVEKRVLLEMDGVYAVNTVTRGGRQRLLIATEQQGCCWEMDPDTLEKTCVWNGPGGVMGFADNQAQDGSFIAIQNFFPVFDSKHAVVVRADWTESLGWTVRNVVNLPYVHRMDAIRTSAGKFFMGCTLCSAKEYVEDWSSPGAVWVGRFDTDGREVHDLRPLITGLPKNHGYFHDEAIDPAHVYVSAESGVYRIAVPTAQHPDWSVEQLTDEPTGDVALCDLDGDGDLEMLAVQPFHGENVVVKKQIDGKYITVWSYGASSAMGHVAWGGTILGKPAFLFGYRQGRGELVLLTCEGGRYTTAEIDCGEGPANLCVLHGKDQEMLLTSSIAQGRAVLYKLSKSPR